MLETLLDQGVLSHLDVEFVRALRRIAPHEPEEVFLAAALASRAVGQGHVCVDLDHVERTGLLDAEGNRVEGHPLPSVSRWAFMLHSSALVGDGSVPSPLVMDAHRRVYLYRYFDYERRLAALLHMRAAQASPCDDELAHVLAQTRALDGLHAHQQRAVVTAALRGLTVITGGPGTGKTTTVVRVLATLIAQAIARDEAPPKIVLLAPTGKAAGRLIEAITAGKQQLRSDIAAAIPTQASTIHRALGSRRDKPTQFTYGPEQPLVADVVLVDEASMVDLALMVKLLEAVPPHAKLILLGDRDQLVSVEAGAVFGDICGDPAHHGVSPEFLGRVRRFVDMPALAASSNHASSSASAIADCVAPLTHSYRFGEHSAIGRIARATQAGAADELGDLLDRCSPDEVTVVALQDPAALAEQLRRDIVHRFAPLLRLREPEEKLAFLSRYRLLTAHRRGRFGSETVNALVETTLRRVGLLRDRATFYDGRPLLIVHNDYQLDLFNGDIGVLVRNARGELRAAFPGLGGGVRFIAPSRLPPHEPVFAMTVHKSQGSECDHVGLLLPPQVSPLLTRELVYTGITRARRQVTVYGDRSVLEEAVRRAISRHSGLRERLFGARHREHVPAS